MMDAELAQELVNELGSSMESLEAQHGALVQFLKDKGVVTDEEFGPYLERAAKSTRGAVAGGAGAAGSPARGREARGGTGGGEGKGAEGREAGGRAGGARSPAYSSFGATHCRSLVRVCR